MGECILKVAGLLALEKIREHLPTYFQGIQFGAQYTQGCEHIIYNVRQHFRDRPKEVIVAADLENAFNSISRSAIFRAVRGDPKLLPIEGITLFSYGTTSTLHLGEGQCITSSRGVKQGDPMAPILFAIGIQGAIARVAANFTGTLKVWAYLDDVTFDGEPKVCAEALEALREELKHLGLRLNTAKCKVATRREDLFSEFSGSRMVHSPGGVKLLGAFIGVSEAREEEWVLSKAPKVISFLGKLKDISRQCALPLLRLCGSPRWNYIVRTHDPPVTKVANTQVDKAVLACAEALLGGMGSLGKTPFSNNLFTADFLGTIPFAHKAEDMQAKAKNALQGRPQGMSAKEQRRNLCEAALGKAPTATQLVCMRQTQNIHSTKWMNAWPNRPEYYMRDPQWETAARLRYLVAPTSEPELQCVCGATLRNEEFCVHALDCKKVKGKTQASRHKEVKETFRNLLVQYGFKPDLHEPRFDNGRGPDICFQLGRKTALVDVTVVNPLAPSYVEKEAAEPSHTLRMAEANKRRSHDEMATARGMEFYPLAFTTYGIPGPETLNFLTKVARAHSSDKNGCMSHLLMAIGVAIQKGNAQIVQAAVQDWYRRGVRG